MGFADGENLVARYQAIVKAGRTPRAGIEYEKDVLVWHEEITEQFVSDVVRLSYYQTVSGDDLKLEEIHERITGVRFGYSPENQDDSITYSGSLYPRIFKKESRSAKTKSVDINLTIDVLRHAADPRIDIIFLLSGDGDFLPLAQEVSRNGKQVWLAAFSSGLSRRLRHVADEFIDLDELFFEPEAT
ncbi:NYN domain-containing protein [Acidovorax radicis]|uniref:NYN domain-containing protein n=1 Tax=Acidovorax radicis TaxID=758826 RepID=UPI00131F14DE|nr:NYN domain-containing protein [Acidovorax radicis]